MANQPRRLRGRLLLALNLLAASGAAAACVAAFLRPHLFGLDAAVIAPDLQEQHGRLLIVPLTSGSTIAVVLAAVALLLANLAWVLRRPAASAPVTHVVSETETGPVRVAREALEAGLRAAGEALPEITRLRVFVDAGGGRRVLVVGQFQCAEGADNLAASQRLRHALSDRFGSMVRLPAGTKVEFDLEFAGFAGKFRGAPPAADSETKPIFTGPQYPIEDEEHGGGSR